MRSRIQAWLDSGPAIKVPEILVWFWVVKLLTTATGEAASDFLVFDIDKYLAVVLGFLALIGSLTLQLWLRRYSSWAYWLAVTMVAVFGTMAADVLHIVFGVPYAASAAFFAAALALIFGGWRWSERTLSIHSVDRPRRELFYWAAVVATFALGTATGDMTATTLKLGYLNSIYLFTALIAVPAIAYRVFRANPVACFWFAYILTRPLGASIADGLGRAPAVGGIGFGLGRTTLVFSVLIVILVGLLAASGREVQRPARAQGPAGHALPG